MPGVAVMAIAVFLVATISTTLAQTSEVFVIDQHNLIELALKASEEYQKQMNAVSTAEYKFDQTRAQILPQVNDETSWTHNFNYPGEELDRNEISNTVSGTQILWTFGRINNALSAARKAILVSGFDKEKKARDITYLAKYAYYTAVLAEEIYGIVQLSYENATANKKILEDRSLKGRVSKHDNIKTSADIAARIPTVNNAAVSLETSLNSLKVICDLPYDSDVKLAERFAVQYKALDPNKLEVLLLDQEPRLKALKETIMLREKLVRQQRAGYFPALSAFGNYKYKGGDDEAIVSQSDLESYTSAGLKVNVPIFTGGETTAKLRQAQIDKLNAELDLKKEEEDRILELENAMADYDSYVGTLGANDDAVSLAGESFELSQELFKTGQISVSDLNDAELQLTTQRLSRYRTLYWLNITLAKIEQLTGVDELR
jgi:outer membrane protein